jgi:aldose 1-epimerase
MRFKTSEYAADGTSLSLYALSGPDGLHAAVCPELGCNCVVWRVPHRGLVRDLLYCPLLAELAERPTRGGVPVLFPFPNRIRDGGFVWDGRQYQLPRNDSTQRNAIHGFAPRNPWDVLAHDADATGAWLRTEFALFSPTIKSRFPWPASGALELTIRLTPHALRYEAVVRSLGDQPFPFGLGYHPYFATTRDCRVQTPARARWELADSLPTGRRLPLDGGHDLRRSRPVADVTLDDVYTDLGDAAPGADGLIERGRVEYPDVGGALTVRTSPAFPELVLFTPPHRQAVCLEPYTCPTDAIHLQQRDDVGWRVLPPGERWEGVVEYRWESV